MLSLKIRWSCNMGLREPQVNPHFRGESRSLEPYDFPSSFEACSPRLGQLLELDERGSRELMHKHLILANLASAV